MANTMHIVFTTASNEDEAEAISKMLLDRRLAACVQEIGIGSSYRWEGSVQCDREQLLLIKTASDRVEETIAAISEIHSYDVPEIIAVAVTDALPGYLKWVIDQTR